MKISKFTDSMREYIMLTEADLLYRVPGRFEGKEL